MPPGPDGDNRTLTASLLRAIDLDRIHSSATDFRAGRPFPHIIIDHMLASDAAAAMLDALDNEFPDVLITSPEACKRRADEMNAALGTARTAKIWHCTVHGPGNGGHLKLGANNPNGFTPMVRALMQVFKSDPFVRSLESLTGIAPLLVDGMNVGSGPMQIFANGSLQVHADFNRHPVFPKWERRVVTRHNGSNHTGLSPCTCTHYFSSYLTC